MNYDNGLVRRQDRLLSEERALALLEQGEYGVLSMLKEDGSSAYGVPINYVWDGESSLYLHGACEGEMLRCLGRYPHVSFCVVGATKVIPSRFTTEYESIVLSCTAHTGLPDDERMRALQLLMQKYTPDHVREGQPLVRQSFPRTEIIRLDIRSFSGKCKRM